MFHARLLSGVDVSSKRMTWQGTSTHAIEAAEFITVLKILISEVYSSPTVWGYALCGRFVGEG
jgi:hypothetical protein